MKITVTIDRLILDGLSVPQGERQALREAVAAELGRLLSEQGLSADWLEGRAVPRLQAGSLDWQAGTGPQLMGQRIAQAVVPSLGGGEATAGRVDPGGTR